MRRAITVVLIAVTAAGVAADEPAPVPAGPPVEVASLPALGDVGPAGPMQLEAADADAGRLRNALARLVRVNLIEPSTPAARLTGRFGPSTRPYLAKVMASGGLGPLARAIKPTGRGPTVDLDFVGAGRDDLYRLAAMVLRTNIVVAAPGPATLDVMVTRMPAQQVVDVMTARLGLLRTHHGDLWWIRAADGPTLDRALLKRKGPRKVSVDVVGARAGEVYALLAKLGVTGGGAACDGGPPLTFRVQDLPLGAVLAVTAALSGQPPIVGVGCAGDAPVTAFRELGLHGVAAIATRRAAVFATGSGGVVVATRWTALGEAQVIEVGAGYVELEAIARGAAGPERGTFQVHAADLVIDEGADDVAPAAPASPFATRSTAELERVVGDGRLAATIELDGRREALFELPDHRWFLIDPFALRDLPHDTIRIEPGKVSYRFADPDPSSANVRTGLVLLRPSR